MMQLLAPLVPLFPLVAYILVLLFITLYACLSAIEFAAALFMALPNPPITRDTIERYFGPAWESTNVFLVFSLVGLVMFFPHVENYLALLYFPAGIALSFYFLRILGILGIFYADMQGRSIRALFAIGSIGAALSLTGAAYLALTGMVPPLLPTTLSWSLWSATLGGILMLGGSFIARFGNTEVRARLQSAQLIGIGLFWIGSGGVLSFAPELVHPGLIPLVAFLVIIVSTIAGLRLHDRAHPLAAYLAYCLAAAALIYGTAFAHLPFLIYPTLTIDQGFTAPEMFVAMLSVVPFGLVVAIPTVALLWHLYARADR